MYNIEKTCYCAHFNLFACPYTLLLKTFFFKLFIAIFTFPFITVGLGKL